MLQNRTQILFFVVIFLAAIGLISMLINNPLALLGSLIVTASVIGLFLLVFRLVMDSKNVVQRKSGKKPLNEQRAYMKAVKYSKRKYGKKSSHRRPDKVKNALRRRNAPHLTVIEGKKSKKKDRALH